MNRRPSLLGLCAITIAVLVIVIPERSSHVSWAIPMKETRAKLAYELNRSKENPDQGKLVRDAAQTLLNEKFLDGSQHVLKTALERRTLKNRWTVHLVYSELALRRGEFELAHEHGTHALSYCQKDTTCPQSQSLKIQVYNVKLRAGIDSGFDPKKEPAKFVRAMEQATPTFVPINTDSPPDAGVDSDTE